MKDNEQITIGFMGDVMLGRLVNEKVKQAGFAYPWGNMREVLVANDANICNLETTLTKSTNKVPKVFNFKAHPTHVGVLKEGNITLVSLANNHSLDFGPEGLHETIRTLDNANILHVGAGENAAQAYAAAIFERKGIRIGVLGYTDNEPSWRAGKHKPGTAYVRIGDIDAVKQEIIKLRAQVDVLIVTLHWGPNMVTEPAQIHRDFAHKLIDLGVDIIHGHSAHVVQGVEVYKNKLIMYDTGDFVDDYAVDPYLRNDLSFLFQVTVNKKDVHSLAIVPVRISDMQVNRAVAKEAQTIIETVVERSRKLGAEFSPKKSEITLQLR